MVARRIPFPLRLLPCRERCCPDGENAFSVEHYRPQTLARDAVCDYDNLLYMCCRCNSAKRELTGILNPAEVPLADHLEIVEDGTISGLTDEGWDLIGVCQLDRPNLTEFRQGIFDVLRALNDLSRDAKRTILCRYFGFPSNLPRLSNLRPPRGNLLPIGIKNSYYERLQFYLAKSPAVIDEAIDETLFRFTH